MIGKKLGPYEVVEAIGAGGMGEVYRAKDTRLDRHVAIKVLPAHLSENPEVRQRFEREAKSVSSLNHPNICTLYDVGHEDGVDFLVMELLEGETLADRLERGALPVEEVLRYAAQIADALDKAHRQGLVHRDLKPGNVMITRTGAKLLDFGLARATGLAPSVTELTSSPTVSQPLTAEGTIVGTYQYMPPEQLEGVEADARSDIFSFGAVLYEMATGQKAFQGRSQASLIGSIMSSQPAPVSQISAMVPPALDRVVQQCLAKDPDARYQSAHVLKLLVVCFAVGGSQAGVPARVSGRRRATAWGSWVAVAALAIVSITLGVLLWQNTSVAPQVLRATILPPEDTQLALDTVHPGPVTVSPDGTMLAFSATSRGGSTLLYLRRLDQATAQPLPGTEGAGYPFWSPDSRYIGFFANGKMLRVAAVGGPPLQLCDAAVGKGGTWNKDDVILFAPSFNGPIHRVNAAGGVSEAITELNTNRGENSHRFPQFLPDGKHFLYFSRSGAAVSDSLGSALRVTSLDDPREELVMRSQYRPVYAAGHLLFVRQATLMAQRFDVGRRQLMGDPFPVTEDITLLPGARVGVFSSSENGVMAYQTGGGSSDYRLSWIDRDGNRTQGLSETAGYGGVRLSPDARSVVVEVFDDRSGTSDLWIYEFDRGIRARFTFDQSSDVNPLWSPDGERILFASSRNGAFDLFMKDVGGAVDEEPFYASPQGKFPDSWSKDGKHVTLRVINSETGSDVWILEMKEGAEPKPFLQTSFNELYAQISPDGAWLAYTSNESGEPQVYITTFPEPGRKWQVSTETGVDPRWRADGRELFFISNENKMMAVSIEAAGRNLSLGSPQELFDFSTADDYDVTPDGQRFFVSEPVDTLRFSPVQLIVNWPQEAEGR